MLLGLYAESPRLEPMAFDAIMPALQRGDLDIGVIIHEGRFTYQEYGLDCLLDLGDWWEKETDMPIPLGCIAARRDLPVGTIRQIETSIQESVIYGLENRKTVMPYVAEHAQEMAPSVIEQHIDLYVNDFTVDLGDEGHRAVKTLFQMAEKAALMPEMPYSLYADESMG
jgi:1,4-dihydroxy-6-naphthoate synthase